MNDTLMTSEEVRDKGQALYEASIRSIVETPENIGKVVAINVETGEWAMDDRLIALASRKVRGSTTGAKVWSVRVGYDAMETFGGRLKRAKV